MYGREADLWLLNSSRGLEIKNPVGKKVNPEPLVTPNTGSLPLIYRALESGCWWRLSHFGDYGHNYDRELSIHVTCGDLDVKSERFTTYCPEDYMYWGENEVKHAVEPMKEVIALLQKELGETVPPITDHFFIWLCYFFPQASNLDVEHKLSFKDAARNAKPTPSSVQSALDEFHKSREFENSLRKLVSKWETDKRQESKYSKIVAESVRLLAQRSEKETLERLGRDADRFYSITNDYDLRELPKQLVLDLILRTSLEASSYDAGSIADKYVESRVSYRCYGGKTLKVFSSMHGDGASYPTWEEIQLEFTLPDGKVLKLEAKDRPLEVEKLSPVTELLKEGIIQRMGGENIPKIGNLFTAAYFLHALEFDGCFLGEYKKLIPPESEEEWSEEEPEESEP